MQSNTTVIKRRGRSNTQLTNPFLKQQVNNSTLRRHSYDNIMIQKDKELPGITVLQKETPLVSTDEFKTYMFDYDSLPNEVKQLLQVYKEQGKLEIRQMTIKSQPNSNDSSSTDSDDEEEGDDEENTVNYNELIIGNNTHNRDRERDIAILNTTALDNAVFTKLIQTSPSDQGWREFYL